MAVTKKLPTPKQMRARAAALDEMMEYMKAEATRLRRAADAVEVIRAEGKRATKARRGKPRAA